MMPDVTLLVFLKGVDLVAGTATLTLVDKMDFGGILLGLKRLESYRFTMDSDEPDTVVAALRRVLATQSRFYNRNKHNYLFECSWNSRREAQGITREEMDRRLVAEMTRQMDLRSSEDFDRKKAGKKVILYDVPIYKADVLIEEKGTSAKAKLARYLEAETGSERVTVSELGTRWWLALRVDTEEEARSITERIVISDRRDRGLLMNPNYQHQRIISLEEMTLELE
jgi:hypothetical protein